MTTQESPGWPPPAPVSDDDCDADVSSGSTVSDLEASDEDDGAPVPVKAEALGSIQSKGKKVVGKSGQQVLPAEILETILYTVDPETFASLVLVNRIWREASQSAHLYAHQLSRCPFFTLNASASQDENLQDEALPVLKRRFAQEIKRSLFEAFLKPKRTIVSLVSTTTSSSAAFPHGEAFDFTFSPNGRWTLALSSARIYVLDTASAEVSVKREFKVLRRPISAAILDDASTLVVLSSRSINIYDVSDHKTQHKRSVTLDSSPHGMAVSPKGEVLAIACMAGVELHSLASHAGELDRRSVRCDRVDNLAFSSDATMLLGTTRQSHNPYTVALTAPYAMDENQDLPPSDTISHMWTSQIIIPHSSRDCSHSTLLSNRNDGDASWTFTFDRMFESFRAVRTDDLRNGTTYFTGPKRKRRSKSKPSRHKLMPCTLPSATKNGELVASGFYGKDVWIYGVPGGLDTPMIHQPDEVNSNASAPSTPVSAPRTPTRTLSRGETSNVSRLPRWEALLDKYRNVFARGKRVAEIPGITTLSWVESYNESNLLRERLLVAAPGGVARDAELGQEEFAGADGGRLMILDFDKTLHEGLSQSVILEVGTNDPELLEEEDMDIEKEVELVRRRTKKESRPFSTVPGAADVPPLPPGPSAPANMHYLPIASTLSPAPGTSAPAGNVPHSSSGGSTAAEPSTTTTGTHSQSVPRAPSSLHRAATAAAGYRGQHAPRGIQHGVVEYRRPGGRGQLPDESDADNWIPPPPPYQPKADIPLPEHLRQTLLPKPSEPSRRVRNTLRRPQRVTTMFESSTSRSFNPRSEHQGNQPRAMTARSVSESLDLMSGPRSTRPPDTTSTTVNDSTGPSDANRRPSLSRRRPVSLYVGKVANSLRRKSNPRLRPGSSDNANDIPPIPALPSNSRTVPSSPTRTRSSSHSPPSSRHRRENSAQPDNNAIPQIPSMPSAEQLANLSNRYKQPPPKPIQRKPIPPSLITSGDRIPAPPRAALGAAGSPSSNLIHNHQRQNSTPAQSSHQSPTQSPTRRLASGLTNERAARSSPSLLRPTAQRLDTIESISSHISAPGRHSEGRDLNRRASVGLPVLRLDRVETAVGEKRRGFLSLRGRKGKGGEGGKEGKDGKDGSCKVM